MMESNQQPALDPKHPDRKTLTPMRQPDQRCNGVLCGETEGYCSQPAGWGTSHPGQGRCKLHGGCNAITHGRYSVINRPRIREIAEQMEADPRPLDLLPDLAQLRALYVDYIERYDLWRNALLAWHTSWGIGLHEKFAAVARARAGTDVTALRAALSDLGDAVLTAQNERPRQVLDIADAYRILDAIGKMVARVEEVQAQNAISRKDFHRLMIEMARVCDKAIDARVADAVVGDKLKDDLAEGWKEIRLQ
jgi:hypothetical protein